MADELLEKRYRQVKLAHGKKKEIRFYLPGNEVVISKVTSIIGKGAKATVTVEDGRVFTMEDLDRLEVLD